MPTGTISSVASIGGLSIQAVTTRTEAGQFGQEVTPAAAKTGLLTVRASDTAGTLTLDADHGIEADDVIDIFWTDADGAQCCAYGAVAGVIDVLDVPFTLAAGTVLPAVVSAFVITAGVVTTIDVDFDGDLLEMIAAAGTKLGHLSFCDVGDAVLAAVTLNAAELWAWTKNQGITNPLTGNAVAYVLAGNGYAGVNTVKIGGLYDSDG